MTNEEYRKSRGTDKPADIKSRPKVSKPKKKRRWAFVDYSK